MDDLISRQAAIALAEDICVPIKDGTVYKHRCIVPDAIKGLPSANAQPFRHGRWIHKGARGENRWECSECGYVWAFDCIKSIYCPLCGAKLEC